MLAQLRAGALDVVFVADEGVLLVLCSDLMFSFFRTLSKQTVNSETVKPTGRAPMNVRVLLPTAGPRPATDQSEGRRAPAGRVSGGINDQGSYGPTWAPSR